MLMFARMIALLVGTACGLVWFVSSLPLLARLNGAASAGGQADTTLLWLLSGAGVALCIWFYRYLQRVQRDRDEAEAADALRHARFTAAGRPLLLGLASVGVVALCALGLKLSLDKGHWPMATFAGGLLLLFLLVSYEIVRQWLRPGPMLTMDQRGIEHAMYGLIPWDDVIGLSLQQIKVQYSTQSTLMLGVRAPQRYIAQAPLIMRLRKRGWRRDPPAFGTLEIGLNALNRKPELIHRAAMALRTRASSPLLAHWHSAMTTHQVDTFLEMQALSGSLQSLPDDAAPEQIEAIVQRMTSLAPYIDRAAQEGLSQVK